MEIIGLLAEEPLVALAVKNKIKSFITPDLYRDLDDFIKDNPTYEDFKKRAKFNEAYRRALNWGSYELTEEEYQQILKELKAELEAKMKLEKDKINTVTTNGKEVSTYQKNDGTVIAVDNSHSDKPITEQLEDIQKKYSRFRQNESTNTDEIMEHLQTEVKPNPEFQNASAFNIDSLNIDEHQMVSAVQQYQENADKNISVNLEDGLILEQNNILEIQKNDEGYTVGLPEKNINKESTLEQPKKVKQKKLQKRTIKQAGFSDPILLALLTGMFSALMLLSVFIK